ncbi:hypothetical protein IJ596_03890 [bacterium]|nr:hypothetical protein [bacterium]
MLIQNINNQNLYKPHSTNNLYPNSYVNFCGNTENEIMDEFVKSVNDGSIQNGDDISDFIRKNKLAGLTGVKNPQDIVSAVTAQIIALKKRIQNFNTENKTKQETLNNQEQEIKAELESVKKAAMDKIRDEELANTAELSEKIKQAEKILSAKAAKLDKRERDIDCMFATKQEIEGRAIAAKYNIDNPQIEIYTALGDQMPVIAKFLSKNERKIMDTSPSTPDNLLTALQNSREEISSDMINFIETIISNNNMSVSVNSLIDAINSVKNSEGNLDLEKAAVFIASCKYDDIVYALDVMKQVYGFEPDSETVEPPTLDKPDSMETSETLGSVSAIGRALDHIMANKAIDLA